MTASATFPQLAETRRAIERLSGAAGLKPTTRAALGHVGVLIVAAGAWGEMVRESGAPDGVLTCEERALLAALEGGPC